jgi:PKD repeat protein
MRQSTSTYKIDDKVFLTMLGVSVLFLILMSFRYRTAQPCQQVNFSFRTANKFDVAYTNEKIYFSSELKYNAEKWEWDFGDKTPNDNKSGPYTSHEYKNAGQYTVRLIINDECQEVKTLNVNKREDRSKKVYVRPVWPAPPYFAGTEYNFDDSTTGAVTWSWYVGDEPKKTNQRIKHMFDEPGSYKVTLVVNEDIEHNKEERIFYVLKPKTLVVAQPRTRDNQGGGGAGGLQTDKPIPFNPPATDQTPEEKSKMSLEEIMANANKVQPFSDGTLKAYVLDINGGGQAEIKKHLKNNMFSTCVILFNNRTVTLEQLKSNIVEHNKNGKSMTVKQEVDPQTNQLNFIEITAELNTKKGFLGIGGGARNYPYK